MIDNTAPQEASPKRQRRSREEISAILDRFDRSGLTQEGFAEREGIKVGNLRQWIYRRRREAKKAEEESGFVAVRVREKALPISLHFFHPSSVALISYTGKMGFSSRDYSLRTGRKPR